MQVCVFNGFPVLEKYRYQRNTKSIGNIILVWRKVNNSMVVDSSPFTLFCFCMSVFRNQSARRCGSLFLGCFA